MRGTPDFAPQEATAVVRPVREHGDHTGMYFGRLDTGKGYSVETEAVACVQDAEVALNALAIKHNVAPPYPQHYAA